MRVQLLRVIGARTTNIVLEDEPVEIGREAQIALDDPEASRRHARVEPVESGWQIVDLGSHNGTYVDGARVTTARLQHGSVIRAGKTLIVFVDAQLPDGRMPLPALGSKIVGDSIAALRLHGEIDLVAAQPVSVLVLGETGVGKELVAQEIHRRSRRSGAFVAVNCAAIARELAESELFGHVPGAFTGAARASDGLFVAAEGGTLFLDEVGELPPDLQPKLLRALATGEIRPVGSSNARTVDVRVVAATLRDLDEAVRADTFRADLMNRLAGWKITVPTLRERRDDIFAIASLFLRRHGNLALSTDAIEALLVHDWPGNVRELERTIAAAAVRAQAARSGVELAHLPTELAARLSGRAIADAPRTAPILVPAGAMPTREELTALLEQMDGNVARVAEHLGKDRQQIYRWAKRYGLDVESFRRT
ncbi:MAG: sigma 54-interacting transcriptional regulator [Deltaproteobacteria bacterium]|nr:sigma 54-interacting transcriptional regulator [Deltaproteobacteria bacterium]